MARPYTMSKKIKHLGMRVLMNAMRLFPVDRNKVVICNYFGKGYGDNGKAIAESLHAMNPKLDIVWAVRPEFADTLPAYIRGVDYAGLAFLWEMATAGAWVDNCRKNPGFVKRKGQFYVQTWHGTTALKRIEGDVAEHLDEFYVAGSKHDSQMADVILSGCRFFTELCRRAFWYDGEILECGSPRSDALFHSDEVTRKKVRDALGIPADKKIVLYAPTFRGGENMDCYRMDFDGVLKTLEEKTGDQWVFAVRLHPNVSDKAGFIQYSDRIVNGTNYPDLYEMLPVCDFVISDYSSVMFDGGLIGKPVMLFATDVQEYTADRNFYFDITNMPFALAQSNAELLSNIAAFDADLYQQNLRRFHDEIGYCENGTASDTVAKRILEELHG